MAVSRVKRENYITIQGFMLTDLKLKGNELLIYACIYGFSQAENQVFNGSLQYLADWTNSTKQGVIKCLKSLLEKEYIVKTEKNINGVKFCEYYTTELNTVLNKVEYPLKQSLTGGIKLCLPNKIDLDITEDKKEKNNRVTRSRFAPPTIDEVEAYCSERRNNVDAQRFIDYYTANGWKVGRNNMKDWRAAVRTWERSDDNKAAPKKPQGVLSQMEEALRIVEAEYND